MSASSVAVQRKKEYARLLAQVLPSVIHTEKQHEACLKTLEALLERERSLTPAERELTTLLTLLIEDFEEKHYSIPKAAPAEVLDFLMDQHGLRQKDLLDVFGSPSVVSEVLSGKRELSKEHIRRLSGRFHLSPEIFF
jgi:HTH-type transcriptional regulator / antitoxin HigA